MLAHHMNAWLNQNTPMKSTAYCMSSWHDSYVGLGNGWILFFSSISSSFFCMFQEESMRCSHIDTVTAKWYRERKINNRRKKERKKQTENKTEWLAVESTKRERALSEHCVWLFWFGYRQHNGAHTKSSAVVVVVFVIAAVRRLLLNYCETHIVRMFLSSQSFTITHFI